MTNTNTMTRANLETMTIKALVSLHNKQENKESRPMIKAVLDEKVKEENAQRIKAFASDAAKADVVSFARNQFATCIKLTESEEEGLHTVETFKRVSLTTIDKAYKEANEGKKSIAADADYMKLVSMFAENLVMYHGGKLSEDEKAKCHIGTLRYGKNDKDERKEYNFGACTDKALYDQLDAIFVFILGADAKVHPTKASLHFVKSAVLKVVNNENGRVKMSKDRAVLNLVMNAIATRLDEKAFAIETGHKAKDDTTKAAKDFAEEAISKTAPRTPDALTGSATIEPKDAKTVKAARSTSKAAGKAKKAA